MGQYHGAVLTTIGQQIISSAIAGSSAVIFDHLKTSSAVIPTGTNLESLTSLSDIVQEADITSAQVYDQTTIMVSSRVSNTAIQTAYRIEAIGLYGHIEGGSESLIAVSTAVTAGEVPVYDSASPAAFIFNFQIRVSNASQVTLVVNDAGTATVADLHRKVDINGGDLSDTVVNTFEASTAEYPVPTAGDTMKIIGGKIVKFCADIVRTFTGAGPSAAGKKGLVPAPASGKQTAFLRGDASWDAPVNDATATSAGHVLDARMGKTLQDQITSLNDSFELSVQNYTAGSYFAVKFKDKVITPANYSAYFFVAAKSQNSEDDGICGIVRCVRINGADSATFTPIHIPTGKANMQISASTNNLVCNFINGSAASFLIWRMGY